MLNKEVSIWESLLTTKRKLQTASGRVEDGIAEASGKTDCYVTCGLERVAD